MRRVGDEEDGYAKIGEDGKADCQCHLKGAEGEAAGVYCAAAGVAGD